MTFVTGHVSTDGKPPAWAALAAEGHTLAIYMGATEAPALRDRLVAAGAAPSTPVAIVENGTRPDQRVSTGRLGDLPRLAAAHSAVGAAGPSLIIVGDVAAYAAISQPPALAKVS